jgi:single-strand DNA-binding protein
MASMNKVYLVGNITRDPDMRKTNSGTSVCEFGIAVNERVKGQDGQYIDKPVFVSLTAWSQTADFICQYLQKGSPVLVEGRLQLDQWQDRDTGEKRSKLKVVADRVQSLASKKDVTNQPQPQPQQSNNQPQAPEPPPFPTMPKQATDGFSGP